MSSCKAGIPFLQRVRGPQRCVLHIRKPLRTSSRRILLGVSKGRCHGRKCFLVQRPQFKLTCWQDTTFVVNVTSTDPIWFYCSLSSHCQSGMAGVVNPPSGQTISDYAKAALQVSQASAPASMTGGVLTSINEAAESTSASSTSASTGVPASTTSNSGGPLVSASSTPASSSTVKTGVQASQATTTSGAATNTGSSTTSTPTAKSESRRANDMSVVFGLSIVAGGLVVLMS